MNANVKRPEPKDPENYLDNFEAFVEIVKLLREHCPWDKKQTNESIAHLLIEEAYEAIEAIFDKDDDEFAKELGDILLHVVMHAVMAQQRGAFDLSDVVRLISDKMVSRHPHVFAGVEVSGEDQVLQNWENLKKKEGKKSALQGVPKALPSLLRAERIQHKASKVGFDWPDKNGVWDKVEEELREFKYEINRGDRDAEKVSEEFGDLLFAMVNAARFEKIVPEEALMKTNEKFTRRFQYIEKKAAELGFDLRKMTLEEMDALWDEAKSLETARLAT